MSAVETSLRPAPLVERWWARWLAPLILPALVLAGYSSWAPRADSPYFPPLSEIAAAATELWWGAGFRHDVLPSLTNLAIGYAAGLVLGLAVGVALGRIGIVRDIVSPLVYFGLVLPPVALLPVFLLTFGVGASMQRAVIAFSVFFIVVINTTDGVRGTDPILLDVTRVYRLGRLREVFLVVLPAASAHILAAARVGLAAALLVMVVGEMVGASRGVGAVTLLAQQEFNYTRMWAGVVLLALLGIVLNLGFLAIEKRLIARLGLAGAHSDPKGT